MLASVDSHKYVHSNFSNNFQVNFDLNFILEEGNFLPMVLVVEKVYIFTPVFHSI